MRRWDRLVEGYLEEYRARGICQATVARQPARLADWGCWLKSRRPRPKLEAIDTELHVRYIESRSDFRAKATVYGTLSTMRGFGEYLVRQGVWRQNPLRWMKGPKITPYSRLPRRIDREHMEALWAEAARRRGNFSCHLWITVLALLYGTGLRRGELERLGHRAFRSRRGVVADRWPQERPGAVCSGIGVCFSLPRGVLAAAPQPTRAHGRLSERALLVSQRGERLSAQAISNGIHALAERAGVPLVSVHQFRHSCASDLIEAGVHLAEVQRILGHQGIATTVRYTHIADPQRHAAMALHPINHWLGESRATMGEELAA